MLLFFICRSNFKPRIRCFLNSVKLSLKISLFLLIFGLFKVSYMIFLTLFSYTMIYHFDSLQIKSDCDDGGNVSSTNSTAVFIHSNASKNKIILLLILLFWIFTLFIEEIRQVINIILNPIIDYYYSRFPQTKWVWIPFLLLNRHR